MARRKQQQSQTVARGQTTQLLPYPVPITPSLEPPMIALNPKVDVVLDLELTAGLSAASIDGATVLTALASQTGIASSALRCVVRYIHVWGPNASASSAMNLRIVDETYGIRAEGDASLRVRARCGLMYPKNIQKVLVSPSGPGDLDVKLQTDSSTDVRIAGRVGVTYWTV